MNRIIFNGREYSSPDEMPPDVRRLYDEVMASVAASNKASGPGQPAVKIRTRFVVNGKEYSSVAEMPAAIRAAYEKFVNHNNIAGPTENAAVMPGSPVPLETGTPASLDSQLRLSASTRLLLTLLVVTALAALVLWR
jgi:hypothetical protein